MASGSDDEERGGFRVQRLASGSYGVFRMDGRRIAVKGNKRQALDYIRRMKRRR